MRVWPLYSASDLRAMYPAARADATARRLARMWTRVFGLGLAPRRWVTLEVRGRTSGRIARFPLGMADWNGQWYLVPMLGEQCNWVKNVRAADGQAILRHRRATRCALVEVPVSERVPILRRYLVTVPGARPHIPVSRDAATADIEAIAPRYPVFRVVPQEGRPLVGKPPAGIRNEHVRSSRRRRPLRWVLASAGVLVVIVVVAVGVFVAQPAPPPLRLPAGTAAAPSRPAGGVWRVAARSVAGFRIRETALAFSNDVVGRTTAVAGTIVIAGDQVTSATFRIGLAAIKVSGKTQPQLATSLDTRQYPAATFTLTRPASLGPAFTSGATITVTATGDLAMHGTSRLVTVRISARRDGPALLAAGSMQVAFAEWGVRAPAGFGFLGSLAGHGVAEFLLTLQRH